MHTQLNHPQGWLTLAKEANWSVSKLAKICGVTSRTLQRHFKEAHQQTPEAWLAELRWRQALELLREGASVKTTASEVGYRQASTFSRGFKRRFGQSPMVFVNPTTIMLVSRRNVA